MTKPDEDQGDIHGEVANNNPVTQYNKSNRKNDCNKTFQEKFACAHSSSDPRRNQSASKSNECITNELSKLADAYNNSKDQWRCFGYEKAIAAIKRYPKAISSREGKHSLRK